MNDIPEPSRLDEVLAEGMALEADKPFEELEVAEDHQRRLATYLNKMSNQVTAIMTIMRKKELVKSAGEHRHELNEIIQYLQAPTKDKIVTDVKVKELQEKLNKIGQKYGIIEDYSLN